MGIIPVFLIILFGSIPSSALSSDITYQGTVVSMDRTTGSLTVNATGSLYIISPFGMESQIAYSPMEAIALTKTAPDSRVFDLVKTGDAVRVTTPGIEDTGWSCIAGIPDQTHVSDLLLWLIGQPDPQMMPEYRGGYRITTTETPDCTRCQGSTCAVSGTAIRIQKETKIITDTVLKPGESVKTPAGSTQSGAMTVQFLRGETVPSACTREATSLAGSVPLSVYVITTTPVTATVQTAANPFITMTVQPEPFLIGNSIYIRGQAFHANTSTVYLLLEGPGLDSGGVSLDDISKRATDGVFTEVPISASTGEFRYDWETAGLTGKINPGRYTLHALSCPADLLQNGSPCVASSKVGITLSPRISLTPKTSLPVQSPTTKASPLLPLQAIGVIAIWGLLWRMR